MKKILISAVAAFTTVAAQGQTPPPLVETMEVRVVNVEVVVTDRQGNRITGLTKDDFEVFEKRKKQDITNFSEIGDEALVLAESTAPGVTPAAAPATVRRRNTVIFFIDTSSLDSRRRSTVFQGLRQFAGTALRPGDRAMIAAWNKRLRIVLPFSESAEEVQRTLYDLEKDAGGMNLRNDRRTVQERIESDLETALEDPRLLPLSDAYNLAMDAARAHAEAMYAHTRGLMVAVSSTLGTFGASEDKKALVFVGDYLPAKPGAEIYQFVEDTFRPHLPGGGRTLTLDPPRTEHWIQGMVRAANATGVTAYMISGGGLQQMSVDASEQNAPGSMATILEFDTREAFVQAAENTGGLAFTGGDPRAVMQKIADDFRSYYSIGFRPSGSADGKARGIEVRAKNPAYRVRSRQSYVLRSAQDEMADRVAANVYQEEAPGDLIVRAATDLPTPDGRHRMKVPVKVYVQGRNVSLIPKGGSLEGELTVFVCAGTSESGASKVLRHTQRLIVPTADERRFRGSHLTFTFEVIIDRKGEKIVSAGAMDTISGSYGMARAAVQGDGVQPVKVSTDF